MWTSGTLFPVDYGNGRVVPSRFSLSLCFPTSLRWLGSPSVTMATRTGAARQGLRREIGEEEREGRVHLQSPTSTRNPQGNPAGETQIQEFKPNFLSHANVFVLQHQHWPVLLSLHLLSPSSAHLSCTPLLSFPPKSIFSSIFVLPTFVGLFFSPVLLCVLPSLLSLEWISNDSDLVHSGEEEQ